ncbi:helix-turn-helix domain-containing protein [Phycicoccus flavus]|uniref:AraC family transcriptional regulator n=1 Tax=Phycicoccus flavus TaxID=2502783 RepID=A0A8T6R8I5_9MICO|nr:helix-turn-helix domain-containing protein [Phycicoccus flavus]NHA70176.1 AraC family transcriptional regulator [Phycicoccus flavus]
MNTDPDRTRPIEPAERSGVVVPANLVRYAARWATPAADLSAVVDAYWSVAWDLGDDVVEQRILTMPAVTLSVEEGEVPAPLVVTGVHRHAWQRTITGRGRVFAVRLRPAGLAVLADLTCADVADSTVPVSRSLDTRLFGLLDELARTPHNQRPERADELLRARLAERAPSRAGLLANEVLDVLTAGLHTRTGRPLTEATGRSERAIQRALRSTLGQGPKWVSRWVRLQEATRLLSQHPAPAPADVAHELGYSDQAHLTNDFRDAVGTTPAAYVETLRRLATPDAPATGRTRPAPVRTR